MAKDDSSEKKMRYTKNVRKALDQAEKEVREALRLEEYTPLALKLREKAILGALKKADLWGKYVEQRDEILGSKRWRTDSEIGEETFDRIYTLQEEFYNRVGTGWKEIENKDIKEFPLTSGGFEE